MAENDKPLEYIQHQIKNREIVILGDLTLPNIQWCEAGSLPPPTGTLSSMERSFLDTFESAGLMQWVLEPTFSRSGDILDIVLTTEHDRIGNVVVDYPMPACDHCPVVFDYVFGECKTGDSLAGPEKLAWHRGNYARLNEELQIIDWDFELRYLNASDSFDKFRDTLATHVAENEPLQSKSNRCEPPWPTKPPGVCLKKDEWLG